MGRQHVWDPARDVCMACGRTKQELFEAEYPQLCHGTITYRDYLRGSTWIREPIIRGRS